MKKNTQGLTYIQWLLAAFGKDVRVAEIPDGAHEAWEMNKNPKDAPAKARPWG